MLLWIYHYGFVIEVDAAYNSTIMYNEKFQRTVYFQEKHYEIENSHLYHGIENKELKNKLKEKINFKDKTITDMDINRTFIYINIFTEDTIISDIESYGNKDTCSSYNGGSSFNGDSSFGSSSYSSSYED